MKDNIKPEHYRKGEIDLFESWYLTYPLEQYRAIMQAVAERYMRRDKIDRVEDLGKSIYTLERLKEKEIEYREKQEKVKSNKTLKELFADMGKDFGGIDFDEWLRDKEDSESIYLLKGFLEHGFNYIARDFDGELWGYQFPPVKRKMSWYASTVGSSTSGKIDKHNFPEVKWSDAEPTRITDLLATYENGGENGKVEQTPLYYAKINGWEHIGTSSYYFGYDEDNDSLEVTYLESNYRFAFSLTKKHWNKLGINDTNADFEEVE